jgi:aubergine-like protein
MSAGNKQIYTLTLRLVGEITPDDPAFLQFYNTVMRKTMSLLGMEELGRNFYDRGAKIVIPNAPLELWPGYITAIRNHEAGILLCAEVTHKVLRTTTVLALISEVLSKYRDVQAAVRKTIKLIRLIENHEANFYYL